MSDQDSGSTGAIVGIGVFVFAVIGTAVAVVSLAEDPQETASFKAYDAGGPDTSLSDPGGAATNAMPPASAVKTPSKSNASANIQAAPGTPSPEEPVDPTAKSGNTAPDPSGAVADEAVESTNKEARGQLDRDDIMAGVKEVTPYVKACYEQVLVDFPDAEGTVVMEFDIVAENGAGRVEMSKLNQEKTTLYDSKLHNCMLESIGDVNFDIPSGGGKVTVKYPFNFSNEGED